MLSPDVMMALAAVGLGIAGLGAMAIIKKMSEEDGRDIIESEGFTKKFYKIFTIPTRSQGSKPYDYIKQRSDGVTPRTIGLAVRAKKTDVEVVRRDEDGDIESETSEGYTYDIIRGSDGKISGLSTRMKGRLYKLGVRRFATIYDVPKNLIMPGDNCIWLDKTAHFVKFNGIMRHFSVEGLSRGWESSFAKTHENYLEAAGDIPEQYAVLNNRINGQLKIENMKSENFRQFEKLKKEIDLEDAMNS